MRNLNRRLNCRSAISKSCQPHTPVSATKSPLAAYQTANTYGRSGRGRRWQVKIAPSGSYRSSWLERRMDGQTTPGRRMPTLESHRSRRRCGGDGRNWPSCPKNRLLLPAPEPLPLPILVLNAVLKL
jgi:hypothetical protein